jgi:hypothetical protein
MSPAIGELTVQLIRKNYLDSDWGHLLTVGFVSSTFG